MINICQSEGLFLFDTRVLQFHFLLPLLSQANGRAGFSTRTRLHFGAPSGVKIHHTLLSDWAMAAGHLFFSWFRATALFGFLHFSVGGIAAYAFRFGQCIGKLPYRLALCEPCRNIGFIYHGVRLSGIGGY
jgi:hypothetical protein